MHTNTLSSQFRLKLTSHSITIRIYYSPFLKHQKAQQILACEQSHQLSTSYGTKFWYSRNSILPTKCIKSPIHRKWKTTMKFRTHKSINWFVQAKCLEWKFSANFINLSDFQNSASSHVRFVVHIKQLAHLWQANCHWINITIKMCNKCGRENPKFSGIQTSSTN